MNQQTIAAFHTFNSDLSNAVNTLHEALQQTNAFNSIAMYVDQFNDIIKFQEKAKAFTCFLQEQNEYHNLQYSQFKSKMNPNTKPVPASSQISIQSTPQSVNDWSYTANDRVSTSSTPEYQRWRGYDPQPSCSAYNDYLFNNAEIARIPFKVIDTDNDSDCTSEAQFVPSLPPSINDDGKEERKETHHYDVCDDAEDDEKWDLYPLIKTHAFTGFFAAAPTAPLEFKNDKVLKPPPSKWQEREEQNREIMNIMEREEQNQSDASAQPLYGNEVAIAEYVESEEIANGVCADNNIAAAANGGKATAAADRNIRSIIGMKRRRSMHDMDDSTDDSGGGLVSKNVSFIKGQPPPIRFIEYEAPKPSIYNNIEEHPHFHPLIHGGEDAEDIEGQNEEETKMNDDNINGEDMGNQITEVIDATSQHGKKSNCKLREHARVDMRGYGNGNGNEAQEINKGIVTLKDALDKHFHVNHNDLKQMTKAIYSLRDHRYNNYNSNTNANANIKRKKRISHNGEAKKKKS